MNQALSFIRRIADGVWSGEADGLIGWIGRNWLWCVIVLCAVGTAVDFLVWFIRWRPHWRWQGRTCPEEIPDDPEDWDTDWTEE